MKQTVVMILENKVEAEAIALFDGELTFREFMDNINKHFNQAKAMEKEQSECICVNVISRILDESEQGKEINSKEIFEKCYKETFKSE